jgi:hypothetical protein
VLNSIISMKSINLLYNFILFFVKIYYFDVLNLVIFSSIVHLILVLSLFFNFNFNFNPLISSQFPSKEKKKTFPRPLHAHTFLVRRITLLVSCRTESHPLSETSEHHPITQCHMSKLFTLLSQM